MRWLKQILLSVLLYATISVRAKEKNPILDSTNSKLLKSLVQPINLNGNISSQFTHLNSRLKEVEVFGLGEATHGTKDFFVLKSEFFKYLVIEQNVRIFGIEANFAACYDINKYVLTGKGNGKEALLKNGYWVWKSQEVLDLIEWMRSYNASQPEDRKVQFYGYDMQSASASVEWLENYLKKTIPDFDTKMLITKFDGDREAIVKTRKLSNQQLDSIKIYGLQKMEILDKYLIEHQQLLTKVESADYKFAKHCVEVLKQKLNYFRISDFLSAYSFRDSSMTNNIKWIRDINGNGKIMLWAHNGHIGRGSFSEDFKSGNWMGTHLKNLYGVKYFNIGFCFNEGGFVAHSPKSTNTFYLMYSFTKSIFKDEYWKINKNTVKPYKGSYLTKEFSKLKTTCFFLDFKNLDPHQTIKDFVNKVYPHYEAGATFIKQKSALWSLNLYTLFDAIIYVDKVTAADNFRIGEIE